MENRVKLKIEGIEFEAEGSDEVVESAYAVFVNTIYPTVMGALARARKQAQAGQPLEAVELPEKPFEENATFNATSDSTPSDAAVVPGQEPFYTNLASFAAQYGPLSEQDFTLLAAYYDEQKNGADYFTKASVEEYYSEARRPKPANISGTLYALAQRGFIMDAPNPAKKTPKPYTISDEGLAYAEAYTPKRDDEKKASKARKVRNRPISAYVGISVDALNLSRYPDVASMKDFREKMLLVLYILTKEGKGEWFTTADVLYLMIDVFGESATKDQVGGIFRREKLWFKVEKIGDKSRGVKRKLLNRGNKFVEGLIAKGRK